MSFSVSLQDLIIARVNSSSKITAETKGQFYDGVIAAAVFPYFSFGPSDFRPDDADCIRARQETVQIDVWSRDDGRLWRCKKLVEAAVRVLDGDDMDEDDMDEDELSSGALINLRVELARTFLDRDGKTAHGVIQVTAMIDEVE